MLIIQMLLCMFFFYCLNESMKRLVEKLVLINSILSTKLTFERFTITKRSDKSSPRNPQIAWRRKKARLWRWNSDTKKSEREKIINITNTAHTSTRNSIPEKKSTHRTHFHWEQFAGMIEGEKKCPDLNFDERLKAWSKL